MRLTTLPSGHRAHLSTCCPPVLLVLPSWSVVDQPYKPHMQSCDALLFGMPRCYPSDHMALGVDFIF